MLLIKSTIFESYGPLIGFTGVTSAVFCSFCTAGTYWTGSGFLALTSAALVPGVVASTRRLFVGPALLKY
jgi:hypothetical protein